MATKHPAEKVQSLFGQLEQIEAALAANREALMAVVDDMNAVSVLGELETARAELQAAADDIVRKIAVQVESSSAAAVFAGQPVPVDVIL